MKNIDEKTVNDFGEEWSTFSQKELKDKELKFQFDRYFSVFDWKQLDKNAIVFDMGCGSGRWAKLVAPKVGKLHCMDASDKALNVAKRNLDDLTNCEFHLVSFEEIPLEDNSIDFGYSLGVLHHIPDTLSGIKSCVSKLKPGMPFLAYIYYAFDNKPLWFKLIWKCSDLLRAFISSLPFKLKLLCSQIIAIIIYFPLARLSLVLEKAGINIENIPLSAYRTVPFYSMKTDALDRFGTKLEKRFTKKEITGMFEKAGLEKITFSDEVPYWCVIGFKKS